MAYGRTMKELALGLVAALFILSLLQNEAECAKKKKKSIISVHKKKSDSKTTPNVVKKHHDEPADKRGMVPDYMQGPGGAGGYMDGGGGGVFPSRETVSLRFTLFSLFHCRAHLLKTMNETKLDLTNDKVDDTKNIITQQLIQFLHFFALC